MTTGLYACNCIFLGTRLHSSKMRTACALTVSPSMLCRGVYLVPGGGYLVPGGGGYLVPGGVPGPGGSAPGLESVPGLGGCTWSGGVPGPEGCTWSRGCTWSGTPPTVDRHTPVNLLPCPKLRLRAVINPCVTLSHNFVLTVRQCQMSKNKPAGLLIRFIKIALCSAEVV